MGDDGLVWGVKNGDVSTVQESIGKKGFDINAQINGRLLLHYAADYGQYEIIELLLARGANINAPDKFGITPLLSAIFEGHEKCVKLLLEKGADKSGKSPDGASYRDCAETDAIKDLLK